MFLRDGKFAQQVGKIGNGPGEYQGIFCFDVIHDTIYLSNMGRKSLIKYTLNGVFCEEIQLKEQPAFFSSTSEKRFAWYNQNQGKITIHNADFRSADTIVVEYGVTVDRYRYSYVDFFNTYFQKTSTGLLFNDYINDTIWNIINGKKDPAFILDMKGQLLPRDKQIESSGGNFDKWEKMAKSYPRLHVIPFSSQILIFKQYWCEDFYSAIYIQNRIDKKIKRFNTSYIYDDMISMQKQHKFIFSSSPDFLVGVIYPNELIEELESNNERIKEKASPLWLKQMKNVDKNDNPILVLNKIKIISNE